jgi:hypothetical protein
MVIARVWVRVRVRTVFLSLLRTQWSFTVAKLSLDFTSMLTSHLAVDEACVFNATFRIRDARRSMT